MSGTILTLDLGNTALKAGWWRGEKLFRVWKLEVERPGFVSALERRLRAEPAPAVASAVLSSVVPELTARVAAACRKSAGVSPLILDHRVRTGIGIRYRDPARVGADRIAAAAGVRVHHGLPAIVIDFGTATTFDVISRDSEYLGGVIAPGAGIATEALSRRAALLPLVKIGRPRKVLGRDTPGAIRSGVYFGIIGLVERVVRELKRELQWRGPVKIVATGGHAGMIAARCSVITAVDPHLVLKGLRVIADKADGDATRRR